jgi:hypothetical protein
MNARKLLCPLEFSYLKTAILQSSPTLGETSGPPDLNCPQDIRVAMECDSTCNDAYHVSNIFGRSLDTPVTKVHVILEGHFKI